MLANALHRIDEGVAPLPTWSGRQRQPTNFDMVVDMDLDVDLDVDLDMEVDMDVDAVALRGACGHEGYP